MDDPSSQPFETGVLAEELAQIRARRAAVFSAPRRTGAQVDPPATESDTDRRDAAAPRHSYREAHHESALGVAFSGGGIRSATFNLGVLQGLSELKLLPYIDYLSTVSGGGYIGTWLHGVIKNRFGGDPVQAAEFLSPAETPVPRSPATDPVTFLRKYSNYLAPRPGLFTADTWVIALVWLRNVGLNQIILVSALAAAVLAMIFAGFVGQMRLGFLWDPQGSRHVNVAMAIVCVVVFVAAALIMMGNLSAVTRRTFRTAAAPPRLRAFERCVLPWADAVAPLAFVGGIGLGTSGFGIETTAAFIVAAATLFTLLLALVQWRGGFAKCYVRQHQSLPPVLRRLCVILNIVWMSTLAGLVAAGLLAATRLLSAQLGPWSGLAMGPPLACGALMVAVMILTGAMGADYPDAAREWVARASAMLGRICTAWIALFGIAIFGPWGLAKILTSDYAMGAYGAIGGWLLTTLGGVLAGNSARTHDEETESGSARGRTLALLVAVAPTVFLVGYLLLIATSVHLTVAALAPEAPASRTLMRGEAQPARADPITRFHTQYFDVLTLDAEPPSLRMETTRPTTVPPGPDQPAAGGPAGRWLPRSRPALVLGLFAALLIVTLVASGRININEFSMHHFYKNRLVRCYLGASNARKRRPSPFTGFDPQDDFPLASLMPDAPAPYYGPYPIVNAALNLNAGSELAQQERKAASFVFTPRFCGFEPQWTRKDLREVRRTRGGFSRHAYRRTSNYAYVGGPDVGTTMAISGAAVNPNSGFHTSGPMAFLLTVFDVRLGWWLGNPRWGRASQRPGPMFALRYLFAELAGQTTGRSRYVNLSDGGHFDNLGLYELVRRRCRYIIVGDGEEDGRLTFESLGGAIRKCRTDFGVEIIIDPDPIRLTNGVSQAHCVVGTILYPEPETAHVGGAAEGDAIAPDGTTKARGWLLYLKASLTGDEPTDVVQYRSAHPEFPHQSTGDQFFTESQFESYRRLGLHVARSALVGEDLHALSADLATHERGAALMAMFQALTRRWSVQNVKRPES